MKQKPTLDTLKQKVVGAVGGKTNIAPKTKGSGDKVQVDEIVNHLAQVEMTDDFESDIQAENEAMVRMLREADRKYAEARELKTQTEYWFCLVFESQEQKDAFLKAKDWHPIGDKYLDGTQVARVENIPLPKVHFPREVPSKNKRFDNLVDPDLD